MTYAALIASAAASSGLPVAAVRRVMDSYWRGMRSELLKSSAVSLSGWGSFRRVEHKPRVVRNIRGDHQEIFVPSALSVRFRLSARLKKFLNKKNAAGRKS